VTSGSIVNHTLDQQRYDLRVGFSSRQRLATFLTTVLVFCSASGRGLAAENEAAPQECPAAGPKVRAAARDHYKKGVTHFQLHELDEAVREFRAGYHECSSPEILFNLGQVYRQLKDYEQAIFFFRQYQTSASPTARAEIEGRIVQMQKLLDERREADAQKALDAQKAADAAKARDAAVQPVQPTPQPLPAENQLTRAPRPRRPWMKPAAIGLTVGGVVIAGIGGALLGLAAGEGHSADKATTQASFDSHHASDLNYQKGGWPLLGVGAVVTVGGIVTFVLNARQ
jgi:tetratricopeptide (TPR) repeat protein